MFAPYAWPPQLRDTTLAELLASLQAALGERYTIERELGRGGMATVFLAVDCRHQRRVAIKVLPPELSGVVGRERFQREIGIAAALQHPNIVALFDSGTADDLLYYVMPRVEGESLRERLDRETQLPLEDALRITREVADALSYAHSQGVVHRDIKPSNILLSGGHALVADFGIARAITEAGGSELTERGIAIGTPQYMSPEQAGGEAKIDGRTDVYALGCVLFEMLAGQPPFTGRTAQAILARHLHERPPSLQVVRPAAPPNVCEAIETALAKVPADRFPTAAQFTAALITTTERRVIEAERSRSRRWRVTWRVAALVALAVASLAGWRTWRGRAGSLDPNRVVVFPLEAPGTPPSEAVGELVALMIGSTLEHTEPLRFVDGLRLTDPGAGGQVRRLTSRVASRIARRAGAAFYVDGAVVHSHDSVRVILRLSDARHDSLMAQQSAVAATSAATAPQLALRAMGLLLPRLVPPTGRVDLSYLSDRSAASITDWLLGEREYARSQYVAAMDHMHRALALDSTLAVAALKGAQAAAHLEDYSAARGMAELALRHQDQLPRHHLALAYGLQHYLAGRADSALAAFSAARDAEPAWSEPWMWIGETYFHLMPSAAGRDSLAELAFRQAAQRDARFAPALFHLAELAAGRGETGRAGTLRDAFASVSPDSDWTFQLDLTVRCAARGPGGIDWHAAVRRASARVVNVARVLGAGARHPTCSRTALGAVLAADTAAANRTTRWSALKGLNYQAMAEGRFDRAIALLDSARATGMAAAAGLYVLDAAAGASAAAARADTVMAALAQPFRQMGRVRLWYFTLWESYRGDTVRLDSVALALRAIADSTRDGHDRLLADGAAARLALAKGDTAAAIRLLRGLRPVSEVGPLTWDLWEAAAGDRVLLAQLLLATGDAAGALEVAEDFDSPRSQIHLLYLGQSLRVRADAAARLGSRALARRYQERLDALSAPHTRAV